MTEGEPLNELWPRSRIRPGEIALSWPRSFEVSAGVGSGTHPSSTYEFPADPGPTVTFTVMPFADANWTGKFERGDLAWPGTFVTNGPGEDWLTVLAEGSAYIVNALEPGSWFEDDEYVVLDACANPRVGIVILASFTAISAYGATGLRWRSDRIAYDGLRIDSIDDDIVSGVGWNAPAQALLPFSVDVSTGRVLRTAYR